MLLIVSGITNKTVKRLNFTFTLDGVFKVLDKDTYYVQDELQSLQANFNIIKTTKVV